MTTVDLTKPPYRSTNPAIRTTHLFCGTLLARDLAKTRRFYEEILGLECVELGPDRLLARPASPGESAPRRFMNFVLDVRQSNDIANPQRVFHHWGLELDSKRAVDQMHRMLTARKEELELKQVQECRFQHSAYSFYFSDCDSNWWEFQYLPPSALEQVFKGDAV
ncbi:VOC family protein [Pseudomonas citronellolis]|uniref:VOC family protein n=1 Tax=Pseudomonas citronellolis TaxID=53408 RepID=UPI00085309D0|nr:VOC family protein [Pseudomonas humi]